MVDQVFHVHDPCRCHDHGLFLFHDRVLQDDLVGLGTTWLLASNNNLWESVW